MKSKPAKPVGRTRKSSAAARSSIDNGTTPRWYPAELDADAIERKRKALRDHTIDWTRDQVVDLLLAYCVRLEAIEAHLLKLRGLSRSEAEQQMRQASGEATEPNLIPFLIGGLIGKRHRRSNANLRNASAPRSRKKLTDSALQSDIDAWDRIHPTRRGLARWIANKWELRRETVSRRLKSLPAKRSAR